MALATGAGLAMHHPLWPALATGLFALWVLTALALPQAWLFVLPGLLPVANLSAWTGWIGFEEFDLLLLGAVAAGWLRHGLTWPEPGRCRAALPCFALVSLLACGRGLADAGWGWGAHSVPLGWFQGYMEPLNAIRIFKSVAYAVALWPMTLHAIRHSGELALRRVAAGMVCGLAAVSLIALWERAAYPGLLDFGARYRITALFWEMHVGGAAIDMYLALSAPFALWALWSAKGALRWGAAAALALLVAHACLTTFSRGVYLGVGLPLTLLGAWLTAQHLGFASRLWLTRLALALACALASAALLAWAFASAGFAGLGAAVLGSAALLLGAMWRVDARRARFFASALLLVAVTTEVVIVFSPNSFMRERVATGDRDFGSRLAHWRNGIALLRTPADVLFGIGLGRLPAHYAKATPGREFSGALTWPADATGGTGAVLRGPATLERFEGLYGLTQRVPIGGGGPYRVAFDVKTERAVELDLFVCEMHLLYPQECQAAHIRAEADASHWRHIDTVLTGERLSTGSPLAPRGGLFWLSVASTGAQIEIDKLSLRTASGAELLDNGRFADGLAHWFPVAVDYFVPWHIDNLYLELLIERGALGLLAFVSMLACALRGLARMNACAAPELPFFVASLGAVLLVGGVSSVLDTPRVSFLLLWWTLILFGHNFTQNPQMARGCFVSTTPAPEQARFSKL